jgi:hypothetical protein
LLAGGDHRAVDLVELARRRASARANGLPALTSLFRCATSSRWRASSASSASAVSARSSGSPAHQPGQLARPHGQVVAEHAPREA